MNQPISIKIWSDIACPFCYIGKKHLESAISHLSEDQKKQILIEWKSFQLDPNLPDYSELSVTEYLSQRKGIPLDKLKIMNQRVSEMGESAGIHFEFDSIKLGNTFNAHKLLQFSKQMGKGQETKDRLLKAYFEEGVSVSSLENLSSIAEEIGLSAEETNNAFTNTLFADKVKTDIHEAQTLGISGVPFFVFNNKYAVSGAQPVSVFREVLETVMNEKNDFHEQSMQGETCSPGEEC